MTWDDENSTEDIITKIWKSDAVEPSSYKAVTHYPNLAGGKYYVKVSINGFEECFREETVTITEPGAFKNINAKRDKVYATPTSCEKADGWIKWNPSGGTPPYKFFFANRTAEGDKAEWNEINIREFLMGKPSLMDANNCTREMNATGKWPDASWCEEETVPYLIEGAVVLAGAFVIAIVLGIIYSCWSSKKVIPRDARVK